MTATMPAPANLEDGYLLYLAALRETGAASILDASLTADTTTDLIHHEKAAMLARWAWALANRQLQQP